MRNAPSKSERMGEIDSRRTTVSPKTNRKPLSEREVQILKLIAEGNGTKQAALAMGVAYKTASSRRHYTPPLLRMRFSVGPELPAAPADWN
jgi:DNA-binding NarL/FixJ family response regulator